MNIKVLRIITRLNIGGPAIQAMLLSKSLNSHQFDSLLISGSLGSGEGNMGYFVDERKIRHLFVRQLQREINPIKDIAAFLKIFHIMIRERPHIVHTHMAKAGCLGRLAARLAHVPVIVHTFHGHIFDGYFSKIKKAVFVNIERILAKLTDKIITISPLQYEHIGKVLNIKDADKLAVIPLGLELDKFLNSDGDGLLRKRFAIPKDYCLIGIIGRLAPIKNHRMFLECAKILKYDLGFDNFKFVVVGDGELRSELEGYAFELGLTEDVIFSGWIRQIEKVYRGLDVVCLTSLNEGTPVSIIEAMASAKAVVSTDVGGVRDVIAHNQTGLLAESDPLSFAEALAKLLKDERLRRTMGERARVAVRARFSKERLVDDIKNLYLHALENKLR